MRNDRGNVDLGTFEFATGKRVLYIVKAVGKKTGRVLYAGQFVGQRAGAGAVPELKDAQRFPSKEQAADVAAQIEGMLSGRAVVTVEGAK